MKSRLPLQPEIKFKATSVSVLFTLNFREKKITEKIPSAVDKRKSYCLHSFHAADSNSNISFLDHADIISSITDCQDCLSRMLFCQSSNLYISQWTKQISKWSSVRKNNNSKWNQTTQSYQGFLFGRNTAAYDHIAVHSQGEEQVFQIATQTYLKSLAINN